jgi:hypothetical protein
MGVVFNAPYWESNDSKGISGKFCDKGYWLVVSRLRHGCHRTSEILLASMVDFYPFLRIYHPLRVPFFHGTQPGLRGSQGKDNGMSI